jgi:endonuclease/exonuclease/phosphatase family metal-dependent hydrolase
MKQLSLLTYNVGLLDLKFFGIKLKPPTPYINERFELLKEYLKKTNVDVIALQEIYSHEQKRELIKALKEIYPHAYYQKTKFLVALHSDLLILSKYYIEEVKFHSFYQKTIEEYWFANKGYISFLITVGSDKFHLINTHLTAGGAAEPESARAEEIRTFQIYELVRESINRNISKTIILGDLNCGPQASVKNYELFHKYHFENLLNPLQYTWEPTNPLNAHTYHLKSPAQQIDHILISQHLRHELKNYKMSVIAKENIYQNNDVSYPLSDHYGLKMELSF